MFQAAFWLSLKGIFFVFLSLQEKFIQFDMKAFLLNHLEKWQGVSVESMQLKQTNRLSRQELYCMLHTLYFENVYLLCENMSIKYLSFAVIPNLVNLIMCFVLSLIILCFYVWPSHTFVLRRLRWPRWSLVIYCFSTNWLCSWPKHKLQRYSVWGFINYSGQNAKQIFVSKIDKNATA